jgi:hypothetical protein
MPDGAQAGDLDLQPCTYAGEIGDVPADCGTLVVAEDPDELNSPLIALPVTRVRARSPDLSEPVFYLTGGPGQSNMDFELGDRYAGPRSGALVRSVYPLVLGLGGWSIGALIALTWMPTVRIDNELLVVVSVAVPIGLASHGAWVHHDWAVGIRATGFGLAAAAALVGAWLGFHANDGLPLQLVAAIVGATAGTNLVLILLDTTRLRRARPAPSVRTEPSHEHVGL